MRFALTQTFPLGRFHATPWKVFPYDDPFGEWPPSPWRLVRALLARSYQLERERPSGEVTDERRAGMVGAFCSSAISWSLPEFSWRGPSVRQYHPAEFKKMPAAAKEPGMMTYNTTKAQDNFWLTADKEKPLYWIFDGDGWNESTLSLLDACLPRLTYFGRAESITLIRRVMGAIPEPNCRLSHERRSGSVVPVLCPTAETTLGQLQMSTDEKPVRQSTVPPGAIWQYAERPARPAAKPMPIRHHSRKPINLMQFAIGCRVPPSLNHVALLANRFRGAAITSYLRERFDVKGGWKGANAEQRNAVSMLLGKDANGEALEGHQHARFAIWFDEATNRPARLLAWRAISFDENEQMALLSAASRKLSLGYNSASGAKSEPRDPWTIHIVPLDSAVPRPPGFDAGERHFVWTSMTPYVPARHFLRKDGKEKPGESPEMQIGRELQRLGYPEPTVQRLDQAQWVKVHASSRGSRQASNLSKRGFCFRLKFPEPIAGPVALGHSCHFGLGLFVPVVTG